MLKNYNEISKKVKNSITKEFDSEPVYNEKYLKAKNGNINTNFSIIKYQKVLNLSVILINSVLRTGRNVYPGFFLEEYK